MVIGNGKRVTMTDVLIQFHADATEAAEAAEILDQLGLDMPSYLRMCLSRLARDKGIPFSMRLDGLSEGRGVSAMRRASRIAEEQGIAGMSIDEIDAEIAEARK